MRYLVASLVALVVFVLAWSVLSWAGVDYDCVFRCMRMGGLYGSCMSQCGG
jgi:hypothetical protein